MSRIGITGHRGLPEASSDLIYAVLRNELSHFTQDPLVGITILADGADQIFARAVLDSDGTIEAIIPAKRYRDGLPVECHADYDELIARATKIDQLDFEESTSVAHMAASQHMLGAIELLFAVWDGQPARGYGGTADVVALAEESGLPVRIIWPEGAVRS